MPTRDLNRWRTPSVLVLIFVLLIAGIVTAGYLYYRHYERNFRDEAGKELSAVAKLKVDELVQYRKERLWDADVFFRNDAFSGLVRRFFEHPEDAEAQDQIQEWAAKYLATDQYDLVCLFDAQGVIRLAVPAESPISSFVSQSVPEVLRSGQVTFLDFHRNEQDQQIYLTLLVPIFNGTDHRQTLGVLALRIDPETYLYPFIKRWPTPSLPAETLLVRRDGNDALFLNDLKFGTNAALNLRISIANTNVAAVKAVLGQKGVVEGRDYYGAPTLAALYAIPDSPWFLVTRMDIAKVYAPLRERLQMTILLVSLLLISAGAGISAIWRQQHLQFYKERSQVAETLRASEVRYRRLFEAAREGILILDAETGAVVDVNSFLIELLGLSHEEFLGKKVWELKFFKDIIANQAGFAELQQQGYVHHENRQLETADGWKIEVEFASNVYRVKDQRVIQCNLRDITERKQAESALQKNQRQLTEVNEMLQLVMDTIPARIFWKNKDLVYLGCNHLFAEDAGRESPEDIVGETDYSLAWREQAERYRKDDLEVLSSGSSKLNYEEPQTTPDGRQIWLRTSKVPLRDINNRLVGILGTYEDITERKRAEESLRLSEERLLKVITQSRCILCFGHVEGPSGWRERALDPESPFHWDFPVLNEEAAQKILPLEQAAGERYQDAWYRSRNRDDNAQMNRTGGGALLKDLPFYRNDFRCTDKTGVEHWMQEIVTVRKLAENRWELFGITTDITERKQVEDALAAEQRMSNSLITTSPDLIYFKDRESRFLRVNAALVRKLGISDAGAILGKTDFDLFGEQHARQAYEDEHRIMTTGEPMIDREEREDWKDGHVTWVSSTKMSLRDGAGKIIGIMGISRDITAHKQMQLALAERTEEVVQRNQELAGANTNLHEQIAVRERIEKVLEGERNLLRTLINNLPVAIYIKDTDGRKTMVNPVDLKNIGCKTEAEAIGKNDFDFFPRDVAEKFWADDQKVIHGEPVINREEYYLDDQGRKRWLLTSKLPLRDQDGMVMGLIGIGLDITERKRMEEVLERERALTRTVIDQITDPIYVKDLESRFTLANEAVAQIIGMSSPADLLGKTDAQFYPPALAATFRAEEEQVLSGKPLLNKEEPAISAAGSKRFVLTTKLPFRNRDGKVIGLVGIVRDITERMQQEEELRQISQELQQRNDELMRFTYTASHDLKSPLVTIKAFLGYLEQDTGNQDAEAANKDRQYIYTAVDKMTRLLDELLDLARVGHKTNPPEEVPLQVVVKDALDMVAGEIIQKGVEVVATKEPIMLCGDRTRLVAVFQNLVDNAIKFMGDQPNPRVEIGVVKAGGENVFFVRDNGMGIDPRYQPKVFGLFEKYDPGTSGTGIGLALVQRIVEVHGGKIWVESAGIGQGTTFRFTLAKTQIHPDQPKSNEHL